MNINPSTGKPWVNNYMQMMGTLQANQNHEYVQLYRYFDVIGRLEGRTKAGYAMILHSHFAQVTCNRSPGVHFNIFMYIDNERGSINNSKEMKEFMETTGWMDCNAAHLLKIASHEVWWVVYKAMLEIGLIKVGKGTLRVMYPIEGRFLPLPYAHVALLSRIKRDSSLTKSVLEAMSQIPSKMRTNLEELPKEDLINEFIKLKTQNLTASKDNPVYQLLMDDIKAANPHEWGKNPEKNREKFLEKITENILENNPEKKSENNPKKNIQNKVENKIENIPEKNPEYIPGINSAEKVAEQIQKTKPKEKSKTNTKTLPVDKIHEFERTDKKPRKTNKGNKRGKKPYSDSPEVSQENFKIELKHTVFYAEETTGKDLKKIQENIPETKPENESERFLPGDDIESDVFEEEIYLPESAFDMFGLELDTVVDPDTDIIPDVIETPTKDPDDGFWD